MSVKVYYGNIAYGAKEDFTYSEDWFSNFSNPSILEQEAPKIENYGNPCELYSVALDGKSEIFPENRGGEGWGIWSENIFHENDSVVLTLESPDKKAYFSPGFTFVFDTFNNIFPKSIKIEWFKMQEVSSGFLSEIKTDEKTFNPDKARYFCQHEVDGFHKIVVTFSGINTDGCRLRLFGIEYGQGIEFESNSIRDIKFSKHCDPVSAEFQIGTCSLLIDIKEYSTPDFKENQPIKIYQDGNLISEVFVKTAQEQARNLWNIKCEDLLGIMADTEYFGGAWHRQTLKGVRELIGEIFQQCKIKYEISNKIPEDTPGALGDGWWVDGFIPYSDCRTALQYVCFAIGAIAVVEGDKVVIRLVEDYLPKIVEDKRIYEGQSFEIKEKITGIKVIEHFYAIPNASKFENVFDASDIDNTALNMGESIEIKFEKPVYEFEILNCTINSKTSAYINFIPLNKNAVINVVYYRDTPNFFTEKVSGYHAKENFAKIEISTLRSIPRRDAVRQNWLKWLTAKRETNMKIAQRKNLKTGGRPLKYGFGGKYGQRIKYGAKTPVIYYSDEPINSGDVIQYATQYYGDNIGFVKDESYNITGGSIVKEVTVVDI